MALLPASQQSCGYSIPDVGTVRKIQLDQVFDAPVTEVFSAVVRVLALRRWDPGIHLRSDLELPRAGTRYRRQTSTALRVGRVVEILRPVSVTLHETLDDPPCHVTLKLRWRIDSVRAQTVLRLQLDYELNQAASFRGRHWRSRLARHGSRMIELIGRSVARESPALKRPFSRPMAKL